MTIRILSFLSIMALLATPAYADDAAVAANQLLATQIADAITTRAMIQRPGTFERNPIARPFTHSDAAMAGYMLGTNLIVRVLFRHAPTVVRLFSVLEIGCSVNNVRVLSR